MPYFKKTPEFEKLEELSKKIPAPLSWVIPDPNDPSTYLHPVAGLTKQMATGYIRNLLKRVASGRIPAYHGTTAEIAEKIKSGGFKGVDFPTVIKETYERAGLSMEEVRKLPKALREYIESDARIRILGKEGGVVSFAPTRNVAERWAGHGGEVAHEMYQRLSEWFEAKARGMSHTSFLGAPVREMPRVPYTELGSPIVIKAEIPLGKHSQQQLSHELEWMLKDLEEGVEYKPKPVMQGFFQSYKDIRIPEEKLSQIKILKYLPQRKRRVP